MTETLLTEYQECLIYAQWLNLNKVLYCHIPNEGLRSRATGARLKKIGLRSGFPDYFIYEPRGGYHGLAIEMKRKAKFIISEKQEAWINALKHRGYYASICNGADEAIKLTDYYLNNQVLLVSCLS